MKTVVFGFAGIAAAALWVACPALAAAGNAYRTAPYGGLDCNGHSAIQRPILAVQPCTDPIGEEGRAEDNGYYVGHDEPSLGFYSTTANSGNNVQWRFTLPVENALPAAQTFENQIAFWFSMMLCDPNSYPQNKCVPDSDANLSGHSPKAAGSAFLEFQFYPPGMPSLSCDLVHWCASLHINSLECTGGFAFCNKNCYEPTNFAYIQTDGVPTGPPGPSDQTPATFTPNSKTVRMGQGDVIVITVQDTVGGLQTSIDDLTSQQSGFMVASAANGFESLNVRTCVPTRFTFRPEFSTAKFGNFGPWAALQANINFAAEPGHFEPGPTGDHDRDDSACHNGPAVAGCYGADLDFDGTSYRFDWPDGSTNTPSSIAIGSVLGNGIGPISLVGSSYGNPFPNMQFETEVLGSESTCMPSTRGCVLPPPGAKFYPFYATGGVGGTCVMTLGEDIAGFTTDDFGKDAQYGAPIPAWTYVTASSGEVQNPCVPARS